MKNTVLHYLENTCERFPDRTALIDARGSFTFAQLRQSAMRVAQAIREKSDGKTQIPVLVYLPKGKECIAAFLGVVYSGNMYTPTDVRFPFPKVKGILDVLKPSLCISDRENHGRLIENGIARDRILVYEDMPESADRFDTTAAVSTMIDTDLVYIFFTSGSTGVPKGVAISHRNIMDYIDWASECFGIDETHMLGNQAPFYFDNSTLDIYLCLKTGACMHIIPEKHFAFPSRLVQYVKDAGIDTIFWVPSALCNVANRKALDNLKLEHVRKILFCGEVMPNKQLNYWRARLPNALYANLYGPTEITDACAYYIVDREFSDDEPLPIGFPCGNTGILLLNDDDALIRESDVRGEICVRGSSLSQGYWNNPESTRGAFCQNPLNPHLPETIYRTGDLAHYNDRSELIFDGRKDFQIKHFGYRIELGEIETAASSSGGIESVSCDYDGDRREIVIFYSGSLEEGELRRFLSEKIPKYMLPARYVRLACLPFNDNGKIDRKSLKKEYVEKAAKCEKILKLLMEIRPEHDFAGSDDFIEDGLLDSFDIITLVERIEEGFGTKMDDKDIVPENFVSVDAISALL
jgi:amino acid adenylation domain-containing protein